MARLASRGLLGLVVLTGCARVPPVPAAQVVSLARGQVVSVRSVALPAGSGAEFVVRLDDGRTVSIVQGVEAGLRPGERVILTQGARVLLAREGS